ncbi:MAG: hypothetical protein NT069_13105 [Planctomycetota bacterium]|nr:hypothetical protein [Planctomycetota bacterium]
MRQELRELDRLANEYFDTVAPPPFEGVRFQINRLAALEEEFFEAPQQEFSRRAKSVGVRELLPTETERPHPV